jgi:multidrug efflux pump subunit AcrA (membrane-fusion protein)
MYAPLPIRAVIQVPVSRAGLVNAANGVDILLPGVDGIARWIRPVSRSAVPTADPVSQTIEWRIELPTDAAKILLPGQQVRVRFTGGQAERMVVPMSAVLHRGELTAVYVASGNGFVLKAVRLGVEHGAEGVEVAAGLLDGDQVALDPVKAGLAGAQPVKSVKAPLLPSTKPQAAAVK